MNKKLFLIYLFLSIVCVESFCNSNSICSVRKKDRRIQLEILKEKRVLRSNFIPYIVEVDEKSIDVTYLQDSSNTSVEIFNELGECVYRIAVDSVAYGQLFVDAEGWNSGYYTIYFKESKGNIVYGEFEL